MRPDAKRNMCGYKKVFDPFFGLTVQWPNDFCGVGVQCSKSD